MATQTEVTNASLAAHKALYDAIREQVERVASPDYEYDRTGPLERLALAYRYAQGGAQPGSVVVKK